MSGFDPAVIREETIQVARTIKSRRGQPQFRKALLKAYGNTCAISGCRFSEVLEAAHVYPYKGESTNHVTNGILLRADLHTLFDLGYFSVDSSDYSIKIAGLLRGTEYEALGSVKLRLPGEPSCRPSTRALDWHRAQCSL